MHAVEGPDGGYRLGSGGRLPPLLLDDEQAVAVAIALQAAPRTVTGLDDGVARALVSITQVMPAHLRAEVEAVHLTAVRNMWDFAAPPIAPGTVRTVGAAVRASHVLRLEVLAADGRRPHPHDADFAPPLEVEPHALVLWAGRWYLVAHAAGGWSVHRLDRLHLHDPTGRSFRRRPLPARDVASYVMTTADRGDTPARWQCLGSAVLELPPDVVARWAPGGSVVEQVTPTRARLVLGAWSWAGIAGLLATFDADLSEVEPAELRSACAGLSGRFQRAAGETSSGVLS